MIKLIQGVRDFQARMAAGEDAVYKPLADGQTPSTLFITCADSRVVPAFIASSEPGELFTMRNVGNLIPRATEDGHSVGDVSEASAIEYAVLNLGVSDIVVCGHSGCGAVGALLADRKTLPPNLDRWLEHARPALDDTGFAPSLGRAVQGIDVLSKRNVVVQLQALTTYSIVRDRLPTGQLRLHGWWFDIGTTKIEVYNEHQSTFVDFGVAFPE
jgi:carbonic anhydrase